MDEGTRDDDKAKIIMIEGERTCSECQTTLKFGGDTLHMILFVCDCPKRLWPVQKTLEMEEEYWQRNKR